MDDEVFSVLEKLNLDSVTLIKLSDFEGEDLLKVKSGRTKGEYCWTCSSSLVMYVLKKTNVDMCTYLDSDIYFYSDPRVLLYEIGDSAVIITEHRYTKKYDQTETSGKYCVQFMTFKNNKQGMHILDWWRQRCIEWCFARFDDGRFGDQKYLDDWTERFEGVHVLQNIGGGVAPWNVQRYDIFKEKDDVFVSEKNDKSKLVFYHFHALKFIKDDKIFLSSYELSNASIKLVYATYIKELLSIEKGLLERGFKSKLFSSEASTGIFLVLLGHLIKRRNIFLVRDIIKSDKP